MVPALVFDQEKINYKRRKTDIFSSGLYVFECARARALQRLTDSQRKAVLWRSHTSLESIDDPPKSAEEDQQLESSSCHFQRTALCDLTRKIERNSTSGGSIHFRCAKIRSILNKRK